jgi:hypothetical protein
LPAGDAGNAVPLAAPAGVEDEAADPPDALVSLTGEVGPDVEDALRELDLFRRAEDLPTASLSRPDGPATPVPPGTLTALPQAPAEEPLLAGAWPWDPQPPAGEPALDRPAALVREDARDGVWLQRWAPAAEGEPDASEMDLAVFAAANPDPTASPADYRAESAGELGAGSPPADRPVALLEATLAALAAGGLVWWSSEGQARRRRERPGLADSPARVEWGRLLLAESSLLGG